MNDEQKKPEVIWMCEVCKQRYVVTVTPGAGRLPTIILMEPEGEIMRPKPKPLPMPKRLQETDRPTPREERFPEPEDNQDAK